MDNRPRRANAGASIERLQMNFQVKVYEAKREYNLTTNRRVDYEDDSSLDITRYMNVACDTIFTQVSTKAGLKNLVQLL